MATYEMKMKTIFTFAVATFVVVCQGAELHMKHAPSYVVLQKVDDVDAMSSSNLHDVLSAPLGLGNKKSSAIKTSSLLKRPKANVLFTVVTHKEQPVHINSMAKFPLDWDMPFVNMDLMMNRVQRKFLDQDPLMLDLSSANQAFDIKTSSSLFQSLPSSFASLQDRLLDTDSFLNKVFPGSIQSTSLNSSLTSDGGLLAELQMVDDVVSTLKKNVATIKGKTPDLFSFTLTGLKSIGEEHGVNSAQAKDAEKLLTNHIDQVTEDLKSLYKGNVMIEVLTVPHLDTAKVRKTRSLMNVVADKQHADLNLEIDYYDDFPVTFNIVLWMTLILSITVFMVAYGIWNMNPNLESILYRVPQDDLKKTN